MKVHDLGNRGAYGFKTVNAAEIALYHALSQLSEPELAQEFCGGVFSSFATSWPRIQLTMRHADAMPTTLYSDEPPVKRSKCRTWLKHN